MSELHGISGRGREQLAHLLGRGRRLLSVEDTARVLKCSSADAAKKLARWAAHGWLRRIRRGLYIPVPVEAENPRLWTEDALYLAAAVWEPCYFSGWTAANHWSLSEQVFRTTVVRTARRVRRSHQRLLEHEYLVTHVPGSSIWGVSSIWRHERKIQMADRPRTVVDVLADPSIGGGIRHVAEILDAFLRDGDGAELIQYGDRLANRVVFKRLGFLVESMDSVAVHAALLAACRERLASGYPLLEPSGARRGRHDARWGLRVNVELDGPGAS